jgi:thiamine biosynthesis lipoprotein
LRTALAATSLAALLACVGGAPPEDPALVCPVTVSDGRYAMGTVLEISLCVPDRATGESLMAGLFEQIAAYERIFSRFAPKSDLVRVNRNSGGEPVVVAPEFIDLTVASLALHETSRGVFDVTVGPLIVIWQEAAQAGRLPDPARLAAARALVGSRVVDVDPETRTVGLRERGAMLDFGGIAKGWALDRLAETLRAAAVSRALLSFGQSSILALGKPTGWDGWGVLLGDASGGFAGTAQLDDQSISVSGSLGQYTEIGGRRFGHVIDPRSGEPLTRERVAVALASDGTRAEAFSKALLILGETEGLALLETLPDAEGLLIDASGETWQTSGFTDAVRYSAEWPGEDD